MNNSSNFYTLGIAPNVLEVLTKLNFTVPTPIQEKSIPTVIEGKDLIGIAQTGTGKTLAFGVPMVQAALRGVSGLVVLPTRELAFQVHDVLQKIGGPLGVRTAVLVGGESIGRQIQALRRSPHIIICTPGRMIDHLNQKTVKLSSVKMLVLDEADRMLDMGFAPQLKTILQTVPRERQTVLFSATMPQNIIAIAKTYMQSPTRIEIAPSGTTAEKVTHELFFVGKFDKPRLLEKVLYDYKGSTLVFIRTKHAAHRIAANIRSMGHTAAEIHSNRSLPQRREALEGFKNGKYRVLVATDIAARGIDVKGIELVLNFDLPSTAEDYVHRIGRTARAGGTGHAISFATPDERNDVKGIERLIRSTLPLSRLPELPPARKTDIVHEEPKSRFARSHRPSTRTQQFGRSSQSARHARRPSGGGRFAPRKYH